MGRNKNYDPDLNFEIEETQPKDEFEFEKFDNTYKRTQKNNFNFQGYTLISELVPELRD
jgi:hypothetical protein